MAAAGVIFVANLIDDVSLDALVLDAPRDVFLAGGSDDVTEAMAELETLDDDGVSSTSISEAGGDTLEYLRLPVLAEGPAASLMGGLSMAVMLSSVSHPPTTPAGSIGPLSPGSISEVESSSRDGGNVFEARKA